MREKIYRIDTQTFRILCAAIDAKSPEVARETKYSESYVRNLWTGYKDKASSRFLSRFADFFTQRAIKKGINVLSILAKEDSNA